MKNTSVNFPSRWPHHIAMLLTVVVFPLIWVGGLVTTYDAGMAVPDWPGTYGYNMFLYPIETWLTGPFDLLVEHGHRLLGSLAGLIAIALVIATFRSEPRRSVRWYSVALLLLIIGQGMLGGIRVVLDDRTFAKIHGCVGPAFFAAAVGFCVITSRWWWRQTERNRSAGHDPNRSHALTRFAGLMLLVSYGQLVIGAFVRHIAVDADPELFKSLILLHVFTAIVIVLGTMTQWITTWLSKARRTGIRGSINALLLLIVIQFLLGMATWVIKFGWPVWFENQAFAAQFVIAEKSYVQMHLITAHVAVGSLILAFWMVHFLRCYHVLGTIGLLRWPSQDFHLSTFDSTSGRPA